MPIPLYKNGSNKKRLVLYPLGLLVAVVLAYVGWGYEPEPDAGTRLSSAEMLVRMGSFEMAEVEVRKVLENEPENLHALLVLGLVKERLLEEAAAIRVYEQARGLNRDEALNRDIDLSLIDIERRMKRFDRAEQRLQAYVSAHGADAKSERLSGLVDWEAGRLIAALRHLEAAREAEPENAELSLLYAGALIECRRAEAARVVLEELSPKAGKEASLSWQCLARLYMESGDEQSAAKALEKSVELDRSMKSRLKTDEYWQRHADHAVVGSLIGS